MQHLTQAQRAHTFEMLCLFAIVFVLGMMAGLLIGIYGEREKVNI